MILHRGGLTLEFFPFPELEPTSGSFLCSLRVDDVDGLVDAVRASGVKERTTGYPRLHPVRMQPWGHRVGFLIDLDGTQLQLISNAG